jgi:nucleotide-binding universal stress UspA family protein
MVLLCYDGSATAKRAITVARSELRHKHFTLLHVWNPPAEFLAPDAFGGAITLTGPSIVELEAVALERANALAHEGYELARGEGLAVEARVERSHSNTWRTIVDVADELDVDVIVVGARGLSSVESVLIGSVSNAVVHHSARSVLVVPAAPAP